MMDNEYRIMHLALIAAGIILAFSGCVS